MGQECEEENLCSTSLRNGIVPCTAKRDQRRLEEEELTMVQAIGVPNMLEQPPASVEHAASALEQHPESHQEAAPATIVGPTEASGPELIKPVKAAAAGCLARSEMLAAESKPMHEAVTPLIQRPDKKDRPATLATLEVDHVLAHAIWFSHMLQQPPVSGEQLASAPEQDPKPPQQPAPAPTTGPAEASGPEVIEPVKAAGVECLPGAEMAPVESKPLQVLVTLLIHCPHLEVLPAPLAPPKCEAGLSARPRVHRRAGASTCLTGAASLCPQAAADHGCTPTEGFPSPLIALSNFCCGCHQRL
ncbi:uncharacterized protein LOC112669706 isoform X2 [Canis lupus dingo]|uniref:uncharacterized protein LOC112669706 isoform X2 n=1 Tax=Canis lupus dingo TaxID=286419 RepID=UPI000DC6B187|nr:uncharacterized protein LOC112669706 isoform X2 [Canis lupus dingo]XP_048951786.1 uncharacterized protein LOC112669706 isoform X2 [Canis lupus dingo]